MLNPIPILVIAYCRPVEFRRLSLEIERLPNRNITISIDGPTLETKSMTDEVFRLAQSWKSSSKHEISIIWSNVNLGLFDHFRNALGSFFKKNGYGLVLEDDMEIRQEFVDFLDSQLGRTALTKYWSICGYNPISLEPNNRDHLVSNLDFFESEIHTIWGWASSMNSVGYFLEFSSRFRNDPEYLKKVATKFVQRTCGDPIFRWALSKTWHRKISRATTLDRPNWDNFWVLAGWASGKKSLLPSISLSRENPDFYGIQTHKRETSGQQWNFPIFANSIKIVMPVKISKRREQKLLSVWGSSRIGSYKHALSHFLRFLNTSSLN